MTGEPIVLRPSGSMPEPPGSERRHFHDAGADSDLEAYIVRVGGEPEEVAAGAPHPADQ